jgi:hypothetical protein
VLAEHAPYMHSRPPPWVDGEGGYDNDRSACLAGAANLTAWPVRAARPPVYSPWAKCVSLFRHDPDVDLGLNAFGQLDRDAELIERPDGGGQGDLGEVDLVAFRGQGGGNVLFSD